MDDAETVARRGRLARLWRAIPRKPWLAAALVLLALVQIASGSPAFGTAKAFGGQVVADLWRINPIELTADYIERFAECDPQAGPLRAPDAKDCSFGRFLSFTRPFRILLDVVSHASVGLSPAGGLIFVVSSALALVLALAAAVLIIAAIEEELFIFSLLLAFPLAPVMFSAVIYVMKWSAWLLHSAFGGVVGPLLLAGIVIALFYKGLSVCKERSWNAGDPSGEEQY